MERSTQGVVEGAKLSDNAGTALTEIDRVSRRLAELIEQISDAGAPAKPQSANVVAGNIQHIFAVTEQTGEGTRSTAAAGARTVAHGRRTAPVGVAFQDRLTLVASSQPCTDSVDAQPRAADHASEPADRPRAPWPGCRTSCATRSSGAQGAAPLRQGDRTARAAPTSTPSTRPCCAARAQQLHQGVGALELVGLPGRGAGAARQRGAVQRFVAKPHKLQRSRRSTTIERASFALLDYLARLLAGKPVSPLALFPQYRAVQEAGRRRPRPPGRSVDASTGAGASCPPTPRCRRAQLDAATRSALEGAAAAASMRDAAARAGRRAHERGLRRASARGAPTPQVATLWKLASAVFEAQAQGLLPARRLQQARRLAPAGAVPRARARRRRGVRAPRAGPAVLLRPGRLARRRPAARRAWRRCARPTAWRTTRRSTTTPAALGRFDPALLAQARKRVAAAKETWSARGRRRAAPPDRADRAVLAGRRFAASACTRSARRCAAELQTAVDADAAAGAAPPAAAGDGSGHQPAVPRGRARGRRLRPPASRPSACAAWPTGSAAVREGEPPEPLEAWMEELYRRVTDRQTMGSVVQELRASLSEVEKLIDQFFRKPDDTRAAACRCPSQLAAMRGVLSVLGLDQAVAGRAAHARRGRRPGADRGRPAARRADRHSSTGSPTTWARSAS